MENMGGQETYKVSNAMHIAAIRNDNLSVVMTESGPRYLDEAERSIRADVMRGIFDRFRTERLTQETVDTILATTYTATYDVLDFSTGKRRSRQFEVNLADDEKKLLDALAKAMRDKPEYLRDKKLQRRPIDQSHNIDTNMGLHQKAAEILRGRKLFTPEGREVFANRLLGLSEQAIAQESNFHQAFVLGFLRKLISMRHLIANPNGMTEVASFINRFRIGRLISEEEHFQLMSELESSVLGIEHSQEVHNVLSM